MSRELKFRVWSEDQKTYNYKFSYNSIGDFYVSTRGKVFSDFGNTIVPEVRQEAFVVEQYTGLKDKNGKEIYDGDIVKSGGLVYEVAWLEKDGGWFCFEDDFYTPLYHLKCEVIGNIHENPELLGGKKS